MQTGYYAGEREDFMRENLFMTETTMAPVKIALDHGWSSIKGEHTFMETSIVPVDYEPLTKNGLLEYKGKKYIVGQGRLGKQATKTENENYFLLTLAGIAKELQYQGKTAASHVELYAGVPLTLFGASMMALLKAKIGSSSFNKCSGIFLMSVSRPTQRNDFLRLIFSKSCCLSITESI